MESPVYVRPVVVCHQQAGNTADSAVSNLQLLPLLSSGRNCTTPHTLPRTAASVLLAPLHPTLCGQRLGFTHLILCICQQGVGQPHQQYQRQADGDLRNGWAASDASVVWMPTPG